MIDKKRTYEIFLELLNKMNFQEIALKLELHVSTLKRWILLKEIPVNYYNDINSLLGNKYKIHNNGYRAKDQFFTLPDVARYCYEKTKKIIFDTGIDINNYQYIEPSAGCCSFYELLPENKRIGIDIEPKGELVSQLIKMDYLQFYPKEKNGKYIVIGNPPFGLRGNLALRFINHSFEFADFVAFILPPLFDSTGKGVPMKRVKGYKLIHTEKLPLNSYCYPNGEKLSISTIFQVWSKFGDINLAEISPDNTEEYFKIYSMSNGNTSSSKRNVNMIGKCDAYLPSTCFDGMKVYDSFEKLPNKRGYGIKIHRNKDKILTIIKTIDWKKISFLSTNSALNLRTDLIVKALISKGALEEDE